MPEKRIFCLLAQALFIVYRRWSMPNTSALCVCIVFEKIFTAAGRQIIFFHSTDRGVILGLLVILVYSLNEKEIFSSLIIIINLFTWPYNLSEDFFSFRSWMIQPPPFAFSCPHIALTLRSEKMTNSTPGKTDS